MTSIQGFRPAALAAALLFAGVASSHAATTYTFTELGTFGGSFSAGNAVNAAGTVVGFAAQPPDNQDPPMEPTRPARWSSASPTDLGVVGGGPYGYANGINDAGQVVGISFLPDFAGVHATLWADGAVVDLGTLGGESRASAINKAGVIVGSSLTDGNAQQKAVVWKNGRMKVLKDLGGSYAAANAISSNGLIAGFSRDAADMGYAVIWQDGVPTKLGQGVASGVNRNGVAVGTATSETGYVHATKWLGATATDLGTLGGDQSQAYGINDAGDIVGASSVDGCCDYHATLWHKGKMIDLNKLVDASVRDAGWVLTQATAIDRAGHIAGTARNTIQGVSRAFLLTP